MPILLIDGLNLIRRVHAGVPEVAEDRDDAVLNACVASVRRALRKHQPSHVALVMEGAGQRCTIHQCFLICFNLRWNFGPGFFGREINCY